MLFHITGQSLDLLDGMEFSTNDNDNDLDSSNCAERELGAWWYHTCGYSNLNGQYGKMYWYHWKNNWNSMKKTAMKIRRL